MRATLSCLFWLLNHPFFGGMLYGLAMRGLFQWCPVNQYFGQVMGYSFAIGVPFEVGAITVFLRPAQTRTWGNAVGGS